VAFYWGAAMFTLALVSTLVLIHAGKQDVPRDVVPVAEPDAAAAGTSALQEPR
jgi:hypothetical protein